MLAPRHLFPETVVTVAPMAKKDAVSKRLAEEINFAKHIKNSKKDSPSFSLLDLASPDEKEKLAASLWSDEKDPLLVEVSRYTAAADQVRLARLGIEALTRTKTG